MDVKEDIEWRQLIKQTANRDGWRARVNDLKKTAKRQTKPKRSTSSTAVSGPTHSIAVTRLTFFPQAKSCVADKKKEKKKTISNAWTKKRQDEKRKGKTEEGFE